jgi:uncharacterized repeat protein (TIGR02543 family)
MKRNSFFIVMIGMAAVLLMTACPDGNKEVEKGVEEEVEKKDEWPNTKGYQKLTGNSANLSTAEKEKTTVSPGDKYYADGGFSSIYGYSRYYAISSDENCAITIDFQKFRFGYLRLTLNGKRISSSGIIYITPGDVLVFEANPGGLYSVGGGYDWRFGFSVEEDTYNSYYTLSYNANGGDGTVPASKTAKEGTNITLSGQGSLTYTGKSFGGWNTKDDGNGTPYAAKDSLTVDGDITLYAQWIDRYTVSYDANGGTGTVPASRTVNSGTTVTVSTQGYLIYAGKSFGGWNTENDGSGTPYVAGDSFAVDENITLYAQWVDLYMVRYHANGGTGTVPSSQMARVGTTVTVSGRGSLTYTGKTFDGWNTETDGSGTPYAAGDSLAVNEDITLYAQWIAVQCTVTYNANGGTGTVPPQTADWGDSVILANALTRAGYHFGGWNTSSLGIGTNYQAGSSFTVTDNTTLYARWIAPRIRTEDLYKEVTGDGTVRIHLMTGTQYIFDGTDEYRLYRSATQSGTYTVVATVMPDQRVLEDTTADWMTTGGSYFYKVAAVSDGIEAMSTNGVKINKVAPEVYMRYNQYFLGYCGVRLENEKRAMEWGETTNSSTPIYELLTLPAPGFPPPPDNYTLYTRTYTGFPWTDRGQLAVRASHTYMISASGGTVDSSFVKSNWTFF